MTRKHRALFNFRFSPFSKSKKESPFIEFTSVSYVKGTSVEGKFSPLLDSNIQFLNTVLSVARLFGSFCQRLTKQIHR